MDGSRYGGISAPEGGRNDVTKSLDGQPPGERGHSAVLPCAEQGARVDATGSTPSIAETHQLQYRVNRRKEEGNT
jgi:hypothetical protein